MHKKGNPLQYIVTKIQILNLYGEIFAGAEYLKIAQQNWYRKIA